MQHKPAILWRIAAPMNIVGLSDEAIAWHPACPRFVTTDWVHLAHAYRVYQGAPASCGQRRLSNHTSFGGKGGIQTELPPNLVGGNLCLNAWRRVDGNRQKKDQEETAGAAVLLTA